MPNIMIGRKVSLPPFLRSLSARLLVLTVIFVMLSEVLIFVPSVARFRLSYLQQHIADAHLAMLALEATPDNMVSQELANELLAHVGAHGIVLHKPNNTTLMIDSPTPPQVAATWDLRGATPWSLIRTAMMTLAESGNRIVRVLDVSPTDPRVVVEVLLDDAPMRKEMWGFGVRILELSIVISLITAALVYLSLQWLLVAPLRRLIASMMRFRDDPEDASRVTAPSSRGDEIGLAQRELASMQETVRQALRHNARLAALGTAVTKVNHDLRSILSTARLISDALAGSEAPEVKRVT
ncbi:MAG TPA: sensor histidine kinase, partial [Stellaceae bacterium]|nr:sensor histidine kinase [Stellaceae bacterium]